MKKWLIVGGLIAVIAAAVLFLLNKESIKQADSDDEFLEQLTGNGQKIKDCAEDSKRLCPEYMLGSSWDCLFQKIDEVSEQCRVSLKDDR